MALPHAREREARDSPSAARVALSISAGISDPGGCRRHPPVARLTPGTARGRHGMPAHEMGFHGEGRHPALAARRWLRRSTTTFTMRRMIGRRLRYQDLVKGNDLWSRAMAA